MTETTPVIPSLTAQQKKHLKALGHHLDPVVYIGKDGLSKTVIQATIQALKSHELIKIKLGQNCPLAKKEAANLLSEQVNAALVQVIGKMVLLYTPNTKLPKEKRVI